jgi:hypothetical protein
VSATTTQKSQVAKWITLLLLLVFYVATWPFIEVYYRTSVQGATAPFYPVTSAPEWLVVLYKPLDVLRDVNSGENPFAWYWDWAGSR